MDIPSVVKEFLDENSIKATRSVEMVYRYHADMEHGRRLSGCEIVMRAAENAVFVRAELPVGVMVSEMRGVGKYLADLNKKRLEEGEQGYFDLDYFAGRIAFAIRVCQPVETELLQEVADFCLSQIEKESDELLKVVCEECETAQQEEEERRQQREKELRSSRMIGMLSRKVKRFIRNIPLPAFMRKRRRIHNEPFEGYDEEYFSSGYEEEPEFDEASAYSRSRHFDTDEPFAARRSDSPRTSFSDPEEEAAENDSDLEYAGRSRGPEVPSFLRRPAPRRHPVSRYGTNDEEETGYGTSEEPDVQAGEQHRPMSDEEFQQFLKRHIYRDEENEDGDEERIFDEDEEILTDEEDEEAFGEDAPLFSAENDEMDRSEEDEESTPVPGKAENVIILPAVLEEAEKEKEDQ